MWLFRLSQRPRCGAGMRFPFLPLVRRLGAKVGHHRTFLRRLRPCHQKHYARPPSPSLLAPPAINMPPLRHAVCLPPFPSPVCVRTPPCSPPSLASLLHIHTSHIARSPNPAPPPSAASQARSFPPPAQARLGGGATSLSRTRCWWTSTESRGQAFFVLDFGLAARTAAIRRAPP